MILGNYTAGLIDTLWPIVFVGFVTFLFYYKQEYIKQSKLRVVVPYIMFAFLLLFEYKLFWNIIGLTYREFSVVGTQLPLHLCSTSAIMILVYLLYRKEWLFEVLFLQSVIGAIVTFVFPTVSDSPLTYEYWSFFLSHAILFLAPIWFVIIEGKRPNKNYLVKGLIAVHLIAIIAVTFNLILVHDYMYLTPDNTTNLYHFIPIHDILPFMKTWPMVIVFGEVLVFSFYFITYYLFQKIFSKTT